MKVEFFGTGEVATLRDSPESLRPFHPLEALDQVVAKHKKKRNAKATALATEEWYAIRHARNQAAIWFARKGMLRYDHVVRDRMGWFLQFCWFLSLEYG